MVNANSAVTAIQYDVSGAAGNVSKTLEELRQHRTMGTAGFGGSFAPIVQYEKWEIHPVFPHFSYFRLCQNLSPNLLAPLCGAALRKTATELSNSIAKSFIPMRKYLDEIQPTGPTMQWCTPAPPGKRSFRRRASPGSMIWTPATGA